MQLSTTQNVTDLVPARRNFFVASHFMAIFKVHPFAEFRGSHSIYLYMTGDSICSHIWGNRVYTCMHQLFPLPYPEVHLSKISE